MATISDLQYDLLSYIVILMVQSSDGAANLARMISVCREFGKFAEDKNILKAVAFDNVRPSSHHQLFQQINGLLNKCAEAGNVVAQFLLAKTILLSTTQLLAMEGETGRSSEFYADEHAPLRPVRVFKIPKDPPVGSFMLHFMPDRACTVKTSSKSFVHYELVKFFLRQCSPNDLAEMGQHLSYYVEYFTGYGDSLIVHQALNHMCSFAVRVRSLTALGRIKDKLDECVGVLKELGQQAREFYDSPSVKKEKYEALLQATTRCGATVVVLKTKSMEAGVDFERLFGARANPETFKKYLEEAFELFEECRANALLAFHLYFF